MSQGASDRLEFIDLGSGNAAYVTRDVGRLVRVLSRFAPDAVIELAADAARRLRKSPDNAAVVLVHENDGKQEFYHIPTLFGDMKTPQASVEWGLVSQPGRWDEITYVCGVVALSTLTPAFVRDDARAELLTRAIDSTRPSDGSQVAAKPNQLVS